jgi:Sec-independent protein translocase protein TatA
MNTFTNLVINLALLVIGTTATLAAFGGKTWREGDEPILERITSRGWISILCLVMALALGAIKETRSAASDANREAEERAAKSDAERREAVLTAQSQDAVERLDILKQLNTALRSQLDQTELTLGTVQTDLGSAKSDLNQQSNASSIASLANARRNIRDIAVYIPLTAAGHSSRDFRGVLLPPFARRSCTDLVGLHVELMVGSSNIETDYDDPNDQDDEHRDFDDGTQNPGLSEELKQYSNVIQHYDQIASFDGKDKFSEELGIFRFSDQRTTNGIMYESIFHLLKHSIPAAQFYSSITNHEASVLKLLAVWPRTFRTKKDYEDTARVYPKIGEIEEENQLPDSDIILPNFGENQIPSECLRPLRTYFSRAFDRAIFVIRLDSEQIETISFKLKAAPPKYDDDTITLNFSLVSTPVFGAGNANLFSYLGDAFPKSAASQDPE